MPTYVPAADRYEQLPYRRCGRSGLKLPVISLGLWQDFGNDRPLDTQRAIIWRAFDRGITHFDLANNYGASETGKYGPAYGSAEINFGRILREDLRPYRDELVISTKAGYDMWPGPYGDWGSRKYLLASLDQGQEGRGLLAVDLDHAQGDVPPPVGAADGSGLGGLEGLVDLGRGGQEGVAVHQLDRAVDRRRGPAWPAGSTSVRPRVSTSRSTASAAGP